MTLSKKITKRSNAQPGRLLGKVTTITGAARGIGKNIACTFAREGARVIICDKDSEKGTETAAELRGEGFLADFQVADLSQRGAPQKMVRDIAERFGRFDILINSARSGTRADMLSVSEDMWEETLAVTLKAGFFTSQEALRVMRPKNGGCIVNISSILARRVVTHESPVYHIAKAGLEQMTRHFAVIGGPLNIRVNSVMPGFIVQDEHQTRYQSRANKNYKNIAEFCHPVRRTGRSDDIAQAVLFLCLPESSFITGQSLIVDGGLTLHDPSDVLFQFSQINHKTGKAN